MTNPLLDRTAKVLLICKLLILIGCTAINGQSISGVIRDEDGKPVPYANIFVRETGGGASANDHGQFYLTLDAGIYHLVISSVGYDPVHAEVIISDGALVRDFQISSSAVQLDEIQIKARRRDPAYEIIRKAIARKDQYYGQVKSSRTSIYLRASESVDVKSRNNDGDEDADLNTAITPPDPLAAAREQEEARLARINLVEMELTLNYRYPDHYKEERTAFKSYGTKAGLFIPVFHQTDFNFYGNLVDLTGISEIPMISPLSSLAILSYKYKLDEVLREGNGTVYKIRVTPRKSGDATATGFLFINDSTWNINRLELNLHKGALKFFDDFTIRQSYKRVDTSLWIPVRQEFHYTTKAGRKLSRGKTVLIYSDFQRDYAFTPRFFGNEVSVTTPEAYKRDSTYWQRARTEPLETNQRKAIAYRDSIEAFRNSKAYLDSIQRAYNRITFGDIIYDGLGFRNDEKKKWVHFPPLIGLIDFSVVGGWRIRPSGTYFKRFENERFIWTGGGVGLGLKNQDLQGNGHFHARYDPFRQGEARVRFGREFTSINSFDAYLNQLKISNYIVRDYWELFHRIELFNGFYISTDVKFSDRNSIEGYDASSIINEVIDEVNPIKFDGYKALITNLRLAYTPWQKYMREPFQKVVLGSNYPTFIFNHQKGWYGLLGSDIDFDYIDGGVEHSLLLGTLGESRYTVVIGKFVNTNDLRYVDLKRFRQSDPYLYSDPMHSFQLLDTALIARDWFVEAHYLHHFNGAMINNLPLIKKLKIRTVAGAGFMYIKEGGFRHEEIFTGIEKVFKLGIRRRLKIGLYGVLGQSNQSPPKTDWKVSFDIIDTWRRNWNY